MSLSPEKVLAIRELPDLCDFFRDELDWPIQAEQFDDLMFDYTPRELGLRDEDGVHFKAIQQVRPLVPNQPWGIFWIEFKDDGLRVTALRRALRGLVRNRRASARVAERPSWDLEDLLFICRHREDDETRITFVHFLQPSGSNRAARLTSFGWGASTAVRTLLEMNLPKLRWPTDPTDHTRWRSQWRSAFDVEPVTRRFFEDYRAVFSELQARLFKTTRDKIWAHDYSLQLLNRLMFLYFIQRKRWLGNNLNFIAEFWRAYQASGQSNDTFFDRWLSVLFFEAFNNKFHGGQRQFPEHIRSALAQAPYLNGGLFSRNRLDDAHDVKLADEFFTLLFDHFNNSTPGFLERYNFTIAESTPLDMEVAVDPEMIGKVYESLVNITSEGLTEEDLRGAAGIFYTPRVEIDLMCRLSLVDALANRIGADNKPLLYDAVFAYDPADKEAADRALAEHNLWPAINQHLRAISVCDPACGSGSFLVGMLLVLDDLQARANTQLGAEETAYQRRRRIIGEQLYGVDVMDWAVHVAELRLWLQLVVETELKPAELHLRPLLPNLTFKVRQGDSLLQEIGGINFGLHRHHLDIPAHLKGRITQLKGKKLSFYQGESNLREADLKQEERNLFRDILDHKRISLQKEIATLTRQIESRLEQGELAGIAPATARQERLKLETRWRAEREERQADLQRIEQALDALRAAPVVPFVWDIAFVEIFESDNAGFDIVIGNPPYVRQEMIAPPLLDPKKFGGENSPDWKEQKSAYKGKLQQSVAAAWPRFFRYRPGSPAFRKLDGKSDLYIYFYLHGLALLNTCGSFCFITSNSWLDVGYGADLQEFLLKHSHVKLILDNEKKRSFAQADVNTILAMLAPPDDRREIGLERTARFVMFKVPFEDILRADVFKEIEAATERRATDEWRICVCPQRQLLEEGLDTSDADDGGTDSTPSAGGTRSTASVSPIGGMRSTASIPPIGETRSTASIPPIGGTASTPSAGGMRSTASRSGRGGTRPSNQFAMIHIKTARYIGNKWGGKYLRAPDIFFTILEKGKGKLVRLGDIAEVRRGFTTGANEFFYLEPTGNRASKGFLHVRNAAGWEGEIEKEFLKPVIKSPRECRSIIIKPEDLRYKIFMCHKDKRDLKGTAALDYIRWGEDQRYHQRPSCKGRPRWWDVGERRAPPLFWPYIMRERLFCIFSNGEIYADCNLFDISTEEPKVVCAVGNSTPTILFNEMACRSYGGGGGPLKNQVYEVEALPVSSPRMFAPNQKAQLQDALTAVANRAIRPIFDEIRQPDRRALDEVVFDVLGLTAGEREAVYEAVVSLVRARLEKARNL